MSPEFLAASHMSCQAMAELAKKEFIKERQALHYNIDHPACDRTQSIRDVGAELTMIKASGISRNICFEKTPAFGRGNWEAMVPALLSREYFLENTSQKAPSKM